MAGRGDKIRTCDLVVPTAGTIPIIIPHEKRRGNLVAGGLVALLRLRNFKAPNELAQDGDLTLVFWPDPPTALR